MRRIEAVALGGAVVSLLAGVLVPSTAGADPEPVAGPQVCVHSAANLEYSFVPGRKPKAHRAGVIKVSLRGLPTGTRVTVTVKRRTARFAKPKNPNKRLSDRRRVTVGKKHLFDYCEQPGHYYVVGKPVKAGGTQFKAHKARALVNPEHGVHVKLRYYKKGHRHHPVPGVNAPEKGSKATPLPTAPSSAKPTTPAQPTVPPNAPPTASPSPSATPTTPAKPPAIAYPTSGAGSAGSFDQGKGAWRQCEIKWSFDPGPTAQLGGDPQTEVQLLRGIFDSIEPLAKYRFVEVRSGADLVIQMLDHVGAIGGITPSGVTIPRPQDGSPFTDATIQFNGSSLLGASVGRVKVRQNLYAHEIGHALGLNHVNDPAQIMNPTVPNTPGWGAGDVAALRAMPSTC